MGMRFLWTKIIKPILDLVGSWDAFHTIQSFLWPVLAAMGTAASGFLGHVPVMWILMATALTFMAVTVAILAIGLDIERHDPLNKLQFVTVFQRDMTPIAAPLIGNRQQRRAQHAQTERMLSSTEINPQVARTLDKAQLGVEIFNPSPFPISCLLFRAKTEIETLEPPRSDFPKAPVLIHPGVRVRVCDDPIDMEKFPCGRLTGNIDMLVKYGRKGKEIYEMPIRGKVDIVMEHYGFVSAVIVDLGQKTATAN